MTTETAKSAPALPDAIYLTRNFSMLIDGNPKSWAADAFIEDPQTIELILANADPAIVRKMREV